MTNKKNFFMVEIFFCEIQKILKILLQIFNIIKLHQMFIINLLFYKFLPYKNTLLSFPVKNFTEKDFNLVRIKFFFKKCLMFF